MRDEWLKNNGNKDEPTKESYRKYIQKAKAEQSFQSERGLKLELDRIIKAVEELDRALKNNELVEKTKCISFPRSSDCPMRMTDAELLKQFRVWRWSDLRSLQQLR